MEPGLTSRSGPGGDPGVRPSAPFVLFPPRSTLRPPETKEQPQEADALHRRAAAGAGAQVRSAAVPVLAARAAFSSSRSLRDAGQDLVSGPPARAKRLQEAELEKLKLAARPSRWAPAFTAPPPRSCRCPDSSPRPWPPAACVTGLEPRDPGVGSAGQEGGAGPVDPRPGKEAGSRWCAGGVWGPLLDSSLRFSCFLVSRVAIDAQTYLTGILRIFESF